jgi:GAG-polyprotein viral zinc-finger
MIYVLLLQENKFYVGFTERPIEVRLREHANGSTEWTKLYHIVRLLLYQPGGKEEENKMTLTMMEKYGWCNVRGGKWCRVEMQSCPRALLERQRLKLPQLLRQNQPICCQSNRNMNNGCSRCGRSSHTASNCFARNNVSGQALDSSDSESEQEACCYRCGRDSHFARDCYARTDINGFCL